MLHTTNDDIDRLNAFNEELKLSLARMGAESASGPHYKRGIVRFLGYVDKGRFFPASETETTSDEVEGLNPSK